MSTTPVTSPVTTITGSSTFASDLQSAVTRAVAIQNLPVQLLQADQSQLNDKATELGQLATLFTGVQSSLQTLASGTSGGALAASVSDTSIVQANLTGTPLPGTYTVDVLDPGSAASAISAAPSALVTDPSATDISTSTSFTLTVGTQTFHVAPAAQSLNALATAINSSGAPVQALVINVGSPSAADYRLVVQGTSLGNTAIQLNDGTNDLMASLSAGANATYTVNGQPPGGISTSSSTVTIAPGLNVTLQKAGIANVTVAANLKSVSAGLAAFVTAYNSAVAELQKNRGSNGGALTGNSIVSSMQQALRSIVNYTGTSGSVTSLTQLGVQFTQQGTLTLDSSALDNLSTSQVTDALSFLGDPNASGLLQFAKNTVNSLVDPTDGAIATQAQAFQDQNVRDQNRITAAQARIAQFQANMQAQMAKADALIATLQQQNTFLQGLFQFNTSNNPNAGNAG